MNGIRIGNISLLIQNEWRLWWRDKRMAWLFAALLLLGFAALAVQANYYGQLLKSRQQAQQTSREAWLHQGLKHPHIAAHFGNYAYKQPTALNLFDAGITLYTGTSVYMEPHRQNDFLFSKIGETDTGARFGWLCPALVCQLIVPLLIVLLTFGAVNGEKSNGTYKLLIAQGVSTRQLVFSKWLAVLLLFLVFITVYILSIAVVSSSWFNIEFSFFPFVYLWFIYAVYYAVWSLLGIAVSASTANAPSAISILLLLWIFTNVVVPKMAANVAEDIYPLSTNYAMKKQIAADVENGLNGHDSRSERAKLIEDSVLKANKVDSVQQLGFNFEGYIMERGEEYSSGVYDKNFGRISTTLAQQRNLQSWASIASPFMMLRNVSMAASNASLETELDFQQQAEAYRRKFVQDMNNDMMYGSKYGDWADYKVKQNVYASIQPFYANPRPLFWALRYAVKENIFLMIWLVVIVGYLLKISRRPA